MPPHLAGGIFWVYLGWFLGNHVAATFTSGGMRAAALLGGIVLGLAAWQLNASRRGTWVRLVTLGLLAVIGTLHLQTCVLQRVRVRGRSMAPAFRPGARVWIEKLTTGLILPTPTLPWSERSLSPVRVPRFGLSLPRRHSVVVFEFPGQPGRPMLKRVIGLPGDTFRFAGGAVFVNGARLMEPYLRPGTKTFDEHQGAGAAPRMLGTELELLSHEARYAAMNGCGPSGRVPAGTLLVLGDNRTGSQDSRAFGFVPTFYLRGVVMGHR